MIRVVDKPDHEIELTARLKISDLALTIHYFFMGDHKMDFLTHTLANGATVVTFSPHGFKFSDGTECAPQLKEFCDFFTLQKKFEVIRSVKGMKFTRTGFNLSQEQFDKIQSLDKFDILLMPFQLLQAVHEFSEQHLTAIVNAAAFNATKETSRSSPQDKVVDINNWSVLS